MSRKIKYIITSICLASLLSVALTGCMPSEKEPETEAPAETEATLFVPEVVTEAPETETETEAETETETETELTAEILQSYIRVSDYSGVAEYEILSSDVFDGSFSYEANSEQFYATLDDNGIIYAGTDKTMCYNGDNWYDCSEDFADLRSLVFDDECVLENNVSISGVNCYHLSLLYDDDVSQLNALLMLYGYDSPVIGEVSFDFYITNDALTPVRIDMKANYQGEIAGDKEKGSITCMMTCQDSSDVVITTPETEREDLSDVYTPGSIDLENNLYYNNYFDIKILGRDLLRFDADETASLRNSYEKSKSKYTEEAYASGNGNILNVSSVSAGGKEASEVLETYLSDSIAASITADGEIYVGENTYIAMQSIINQMQTKSYCTIVDNRALIFTLYYSDQETPTLFEENLYAINDDPDWFRDGWILGSRYTFYTPNGYYMDTDNSTDVYACMVNDDSEVNIFLLDGTTTQEEAEAETLSAEGLTREIEQNEDVTLNDGTVMKYLVVHNIGAENSYYTYIGLIQSDSSVIEYYAVKTDANADYVSAFTDIANGMEVSEIPETLVEEDVDEENYIEEGYIEEEYEGTEVYAEEIIEE